MGAVLQFPKSPKPPVLTDLGHGLTAEMGQGGLILQQGSTPPVRVIYFRKEFFDELTAFVGDCIDAHGKAVERRLGNVSLAWRSEQERMFFVCEDFTVQISRQQAALLYNALTKPVKQEACFNCYYSRPNGTHELDCRFDPPQLLPIVPGGLPTNRVPSVPRDYWCGRWSAKDKPFCATVGESDQP